MRIPVVLIPGAGGLGWYWHLVEARLAERGSLGAFTAPLVWQRVPTETYFMHDVPPALVAQMYEREAPQSEAVFGDPCTFDAWPGVPVRAVAGRDVDVAPWGHLSALSHPDELTAVLAGYLG